jgi:IS4 transposase
VRARLKRLLPDKLITDLATETGAVQRNRRIGIVPLVWALVQGFGVGRTRSIAGLRRAFEHATGTTVVASAFYDRFTPAFAKLLRKLLKRLIEDVCREDVVMHGLLAPFRSLVVADSTVIRLHDKLQRAFKACRTNHTLAALKAHVVMNVQGMGPSRVKITSERVHDGPVLRAGTWVKDRLLLFDLGYWRFQLFACIDRQGGYFITRLKDGANPTIVAAHRKWRGQSVPIVGEKLQDVVARLMRAVLDVDVELGFRRRAYRGTRRGDTYRCRLVAVRNADTGAYHLYLTNLPPEVLGAEEIAYTYRARWMVELTFKQLKHHYRIDDVPTKKRRIVEALIYAALITIVVSRVLHAYVLSRFRGTGRRVPPDRWAAIFVAYASAILAVLVRPPRYSVIEQRFLDVVLRREAPDPNRVRLLLLEPLVDGPGS